jgi:hypothetical protein
MERRSSLPVVQSTFFGAIPMVIGVTSSACRSAQRPLAEYQRPRTAFSGASAAAVQRTLT